MQCIELLALPFKIVWKMSQSLASVGQVMRIGQMWRIS
jgi:hypothetical protein